MKHLEFYYECHKRLKLQGRSTDQVAEKYGIKRQNLNAILMGTWTGPKADSILHAVCAELKIKAPKSKRLPVECLEPQEAQA